MIKTRAPRIPGIPHLRAALVRTGEMIRLGRRVGEGAVAFARTGTTPEPAYHGLVELFCETRGLSNDAMHRLIPLTRRPYRLPRPVGVLGELDDSAVGSIVSELKTRGYYIFPNPLAEQTVQALTRFARTTPAHPRDSDDFKTPLLYDSQNPVAPRYDFFEKELLQEPSIQRLVCDPSVLSIAQGYLGCPPILDIVTMWWSTAYLDRPSSASGQLFHFDMDRIKWLKFFFYLTDVTPQSGPTCFVAGSHRSRRQPRHLLQYGYSRLTDDLVRGHYPAREIVELTARRGTIVAVDTRGFHKGKPLEKGERLVAQLEFCDSLFGTQYERPRIRLSAESPLHFMARRYPRIYSKYTWDS